jgi:hypothetical protein
VEVALPGWVRSSGAEAHNYGQCAIDLPKLSEREQPMGFAEPARIDGTELLHQDPRPLTLDLHLGPE